MGDIVIGDKNVLGINGRIIKIEMKNYFSPDPNKDECAPDSGIVETDDAEFEEVKDSTASEKIKTKLVFSEDEVKKSFRFHSDFVKKKVSDVIRDYYKGSHANLALIEITLYDHNLLIKPNSHKAFVKALVAWELIEVADKEELKKIVSAVTDKHNRMPKVGYQKWEDKYADDKSFCDKIGNELGDSMPYSG